MGLLGEADFTVPSDISYSSLGPIPDNLDNQDTTGFITFPQANNNMMSPIFIEVIWAAALKP